MGMANIGMEKKTIRFTIILMAVLFQISVLSVIFPEYQVPSIIVALVIAWTIHVGFSDILPWVIISGIMLDIASFQPVGISVVLFVSISYFVSFFSRRFLVEHRVWGAMVVIFFMIAATFFYYFAGIFVAGFNNFLMGESLFLWKTIAAQIVANVVLFLIIYFPMKKMEEFISFYDQQVKIK